MTTLRFVVLHHTGIPEPHYDLLFEYSPASALGAARCSQWPPTAATQFQRIPDHRRMYLDYEGEISGKRGTVKRVAAGTCEVESADDNSIQLTLDSARKLRIPAAIEADD